MPTMPLQNDTVFQSVYGRRVQELLNQAFISGQQQGFNLAVQAMIALGQDGREITPDAILEYANQLLQNAGNHKT